MKTGGEIVREMFGTMFQDYGKEISRLPATCEKHGDYIDIVTVGMSGKPWHSACPTCESERDAEAAERFRQHEEAEKAEKERAKQDARLAWLKDAGIEPLYYGATLETFIAETPEQKHNVQRVRDLIAGKIGKIIMLGSNGTGKTHLACAAVQALGGKIITMYEISAMIRASYTNEGSELDIVDQLAQYPLLVIDEMGRTKGSDSEMNWLSYIIDKRHARGLPLIIISNKHARKRCDKGGCPNCLENYIGEDIMSRLSDGGVMLAFTGEDWRRKSKAMGI
jgi:DNA replication protein DnaC